MSIRDIVLNNFTTLSLIIGLGIIVLTEKSINKKTKNLFLLFVLSVFLLCVSDMVDYYFASFKTISVFRYIASSFGYTVRPAMIMIIISILYRRRKINFLLWIPIIILGIISFTSPFTHLMYWFDEYNNFKRGPIGLLPHILSAVYMLLLIASIFYVNKYITTGEVLLIIYIAIICTSATIIESVTTQKFILTGSMIVSCTLYYIFIYIQTYKSDPLTGILNRRSFFDDVEDLVHQSFSIISIDLNGLKVINDTSGHQEGDKALQKLSDSLVENKGKAFKVYRIGGDEFMAVGKNQNETATTEFIEKTKKTLKKKGIMASFGFEMYKDGDSFEAVLDKADKKMYEDKKQYKHRE